MTKNTSIPGRVCVVGVGAFTAVGCYSAAACAAVRAGIANFNEMPRLIDTAGEPMVAAPIPRLPEDVKSIDRFYAIARPAMQEALGAFSAPGAKLSIPLILGLPPHRPGLPGQLRQQLTELLIGEENDHFRISEAETAANGHSAGLMALETGCRAIRSGRHEFCLIGGVDSYLDHETMEWLEENDQLHGAGELNNAWGFVPGEAAGFCLLASRRAVDRYRLKVLAEVVSIATAQEKNLIKTDTVCTGQGLSEAFEKVLSGVPPDVKIDRIICDLNGEPYRADEFGFTMARKSERFEDPGAFTAPAECWGDVGAASGPLFVNMAVAGGLRGYAEGPYALMFTSSESGERTAAVLHVEIIVRRV